MKALAATKAKKLSAFHLKKFLIFAELFLPQKILIIKDLFAEIPNEYTEEIAQKILTLAQSYKKFIIITNLNQLPQCWENASNIYLINPEAPVTK